MKVLYLVFLIFWEAFPLDNGLGQSPPMGWNSWNHFGCKINEKIIRETVDALISTGLASKGYNYVNIDDCWNERTRDPKTKKQRPDPKNFPSGMKAIGDYIHSKGLKFGIYSDAGFFTCQGRPGSLHHEEIDAQAFAEWGVDFLKYDNCFNDLSHARKRYFPYYLSFFRYPPMRDALNKTGRPIFFAMCEWGWDKPWKWATPVSNSWRTTGDIKDTWNSFITILDKQDGLEKYSGKGAWNDPDMLEVGNGGMTFEEYKAHFALWALLKAPLLIGNDIRTMPKEVLDLLGNEEIIAINQDKLGKQGWRVFKESPVSSAWRLAINYVCGQVCEALLTKEIWAGPLVDDQWAMVLFNRGSEKVEIEAKFEIVWFKSNKAKIRDLFEKKELGIFEGSYKREIAPHSAAMIKLTPIF